MKPYKNNCCGILLLVISLISLISSSSSSWYYKKNNFSTLPQVKTLVSVRVIEYKFLVLQRNVRSSFSAMNMTKYPFLLTPLRLCTPSSYRRGDLYCHMFTSESTNYWHWKQNLQAENYVVLWMWVLFCQASFNYAWRACTACHRPA